MVSDDGWNQVTSFLSSIVAIAIQSAHLVLSFSLFKCEFFVKKETTQPFLH